MFFSVNMSSNSSLSSNDSFLNEKPKDIVFFSPLETSTPTKSVKKTVEIRDLSPIVRGAPTRIERCFVSFSSSVFETFFFFSRDLFKCLSEPSCSLTTPTSFLATWFCLKRLRIFSPIPVLRVKKRQARSLKVIRSQKGVFRPQTVMDMTLMTKIVII